MAQRIVCLLPIRNGEADLPGYFASLRGVCDAIVGLDDGSTDGTAALLHAEPLVAEVLANPPRPDATGWDDASNRQRLLDAAAAHAPDWVLSLDADERLSPADGAALRAFVETDALPGCAYGFRHVAMRGPGHHLAETQWVYRLFAYAPGQRFPRQRLHFVPVSRSIPRSRWIRTTLRIQHTGGETEERRLARFARYLEADTTRRYQADYAQVLRAPASGDVVPWRERPADAPILMLDAGPKGDGVPGYEPGPAPDDEGADTVDLSAIVIGWNSAATIGRTLASVVSQEIDGTLEVIAVVSGTDGTADVVRRDFPSVRLVDLGVRALPGDARNAGVRAARGQFVSFPGSHVELPPGSLAARLRAHRGGWAMVTGAALNGTDTPAGWASYFIDHHEGLPGHAPAPISGPPAHCSYERAALLRAGLFPVGVRSAEDTRVNQALVALGYRAFRDPAITFTHRSRCTTPVRLVRHHFTRGRGWGRLLLERPGDGPLIDGAFLRERGRAHIERRLHRIASGAGRAEPELARRHEEVHRLVMAGVVSSWLGMWVELLRPGRGKARRLLVPRDSVLLAPRGGPGGQPLVLRVESGQRTAQAITLGGRSPDRDQPASPVHPGHTSRVSPATVALRDAASDRLGLPIAAILPHATAETLPGGSRAGRSNWRGVRDTLRGGPGLGTLPFRLVAARRLARVDTVTRVTAHVELPAAPDETPTARREIRRAVGGMSQ